MNGAVMTGSVICLEPDSYQGSIDQPLYRDLAEYVQEVERIRKVLLDFIFLGNYYDELGAGITPSSDDISREVLHYKVHGNKDTGRRAIVVVNDSPDPVQYKWEFEGKRFANVKLYVPFEEVKSVRKGDVVEIKGDGLHILVED